MYVDKNIMFIPNNEDTGEMLRKMGPEGVEKMLRGFMEGGED